MNGIAGVLGQVGGGGMSSQDQTAVNHAVGAAAQSEFQMIFTQLKQNMNGFKEAMDDDSDYPNSYDGF